LAQKRRERLFLGLDRTSEGNCEGPIMPPDRLPDSSRGSEPERLCCVCGKISAEVRLPFAVGREDTPPLPRKRKLLGVVPWKKTFVQRHRWVWHSIWICRRCEKGRLSDELWRAIQDHPGTRRLVAQGYTETRIDPTYRGREEEITFTEEPV
jgi:hypothetical protein